jgi:hypothetical protein
MGTKDTPASRAEQGIGRTVVTSCVGSVVMVFILVGNAYTATSIGYPERFRHIGDALMFVGVFLVYPPGLLFWTLQKVGLAWELRGRESFIEANIPFWVFCVAFYAPVIWGIRMAYRRVRRHRGASRRQGA